MQLLPHGFPLKNREIWYTVRQNDDKGRRQHGGRFIRDKLEIKFLILYIAARLSEPADGAAMQDLTMCDDGIDYFDYAECLNDLVKTEHLRLTEDGRYLITEKGSANSAICEQLALFGAAAVRSEHRGL